MEESFSVKIHSVLTVVSRTPVKRGRVCPLSPLDQAMAGHNLLVVFYYRSGSFDIDRIRPPLNELLSLYPIVTGRLARDEDGNWMVKCTDAGVRFYMAKADTTLDEWLRFASADDERLISPWEDLPDDPHIWSPFRIQVTEFEGGGAAVALTCPHMLADPTTATLLIKSWTESLRRESITHPPFLHPLALVPPPITTAAPPPYYVFKSTKTEALKPCKMASATFCFSNYTIHKLLSEAQPTQSSLSSFHLLVALFWARIARLKMLKTVTQDKMQSVCICTDMRKRMTAPLPYGFFGNALHFYQIQVRAHELYGGDIFPIAELVHSHVENLQLEEEFWSAVDWLGSRKDSQGKYEPPFRMYGPELTFVNMEDMIAPMGSESKPLMYTASFDNGEMPVHVSYQVGNSEGEGLVMVLPSCEEGLGRRVVVMLPEEEMESLMEDKVVLSFNPAFFLSGRR